jgi:hypothetical protein
MSEFHGNLLIGGMALKNVVGTLERDESSPDGTWRGELAIDPNQNEYLESGRPYRLELEDGRAGKIVIKCVDCVVGQRKLRAVFDVLTALEGRLPSPQREDSIDVSR